MPFANLSGAISFDERQPNVYPRGVMRQVGTILNNMAGYERWCAVVECILWALVGVIGGGIHEYMTGISSGNGPVLMVFTGPIGFVCSIL